jgi:hypothetical protein
MASHNYEYRYELRPDRFVYIQRKDARVRAKAIIRSVLKRYKPHRIFYHIERQGGHIAALRLHQNSAFFSRFDIQNFFGQVTRTRVSRSLKAVGFSSNRSFDIAVESVVVESSRKVLLYGFRQSPLLATLSLEQSLLGSVLKQLYNEGLLVSVYMDDILVSGPSAVALETASQRVLEAALHSGFPLSQEKRAIAVQGIDSFNCHVESSSLTVLDERMDRFLDDHNVATNGGKGAIEKYINAVSPSELARFLAMA